MGAAAQRLPRATDGAERTRADLLARAERLWGELGRTPHTRVDTELYSLGFHAGNLLDPAVLAEHVDLAGARPLTDDYAPVDVLVAAGGRS